MSNKPKIHKIVKEISKLLKTSEKKLLEIDNFQKFEIWDSLIHLEILSILEKNYGKKIANIKNLAQITSIKKILAKLN
jgi:acyl carrier protein